MPTKKVNLEIGKKTTNVGTFDNTCLQLTSLHHERILDSKGAYIE
jgi:hypothetical protein